jgi:hypothetical protein
MTHGFITIATGDVQYYKMAANLLHSYRYFSENPLPFAIFADTKTNTQTSLTRFGCFLMLNATISTSWSCSNFYRMT